ncbi:pyrroline-5-carboxylate reductase [Xinfangfangia sp. D13-10-4-6]|uniref:pyrroline-5-carboxylate reductase n=1 Tax=Pseudogemmobacter hezensis TaxID=2737662 RepID=UPI001553F401|nr:pyrroline-5-carboxylate reductase [Pseudogemmobacter hezensis]NPD14196.1 pyrroline-5-carboxylate reductase [Pseudogemmobacter hezensis]
MSANLKIDNGILLLGCGKMGSALLKGWLDSGVPASNVWVIEPHPSDWLLASGVHLNQGVPEQAEIAILAVKPQMMGAALPGLKALGNGATLFISIAAGTTIATLEQVLGAQTPIVRVMPNTPAMVGRGISGLVGNAHATAKQLDQARLLMQAVGQVVQLENEAQIDAVTAVSGSGPAYVFHLIEALAAAGEAEGLPAETAMQLARATVTGSGELAHRSDDSAAQLRINVTSPGGTTAAALAVLMDPETGFPALMRRAVKAAADRGRELGK